MEPYSPLGSLCSCEKKACQNAHFQVEILFAATHFKCSMKCSRDTQQQQPEPHAAQLATSRPTCHPGNRALLVFAALLVRHENANAATEARSSSRKKGTTSAGPGLGPYRSLSPRRRLVNTVRAGELSRPVDPDGVPAAAHHHNWCAIPGSSAARAVFEAAVLLLLFLALLSFLTPPLLEHPSLGPRRQICSGLRSSPVLLDDHVEAVANTVEDGIFRVPNGGGNSGRDLLGSKLSKCYYGCSNAS